MENKIRRNRKQKPQVPATITVRLIFSHGSLCITTRDTVVINGAKTKVNPVGVGSDGRGDLNVLYRRVRCNLLKARRRPPTTIHISAYY